MPYVVPDAVREPCYAVVPYYNPFRWKSREKHTIRALKHFADSGAVVILVEVALNRREFTFANSGLDGTAANCGVLGTDHKFRHKYIGLRTKDELWLKENAINIGVSSLPYDWQQVCWLDSDVHFVRPNWVGETIHKLQHGTTSEIAFLQMFSQARDLGPDYEMLDEDYPHAFGRGFVRAWMDGDIESDVERMARLSQKVSLELAGASSQVKTDASNVSKEIGKLEQDLQQYPYPPRIFPGLAWACTRKAWDAVGGHIDIAIWGGADWHESHALIGKHENMMLDTLHPNYKSIIDEWYHRCDRHVRRNVLCMTGAVFHSWHGRKSQRGYSAKHQLLAKVGFDPLRHLKRDGQGLWQLHDDGSETFVQMRDRMREISLERNEDSIDIFAPRSPQGH